jgi:hypothetical protein
MQALGLTAVLGLVAGGLLAVATFAVSHTDIGGPGWSLGGNGALIVPFAVGPALLAGGWVYVLEARPGRALAAGLITLAPGLLLAFAPIVLGPAAARLTLASGIGYILAPLVLPLIVAMPSFFRHARRQRVPSLVALPAALVLGMLVGQRLLPGG